MAFRSIDINPRDGRIDFNEFTIGKDIIGKLDSRFDSISGITPKELWRLYDKDGTETLGWKEFYD